MKVIKLGGSLLETGHMLACLTHIIRSSETAVVVCGGGEFANQVRQAQIKWRFDDVAAHEMAILAMQQTAIMCQRLQPEFTIASSILDIIQHRLTIWSPNITELNKEGVKSSWEVTSDSLAAWLATKLNAKKLIVVKSGEVNHSYTIHELVRLEIVDRAFATFVDNALFKLSVVSALEFLTV